MTKRTIDPEWAQRVLEAMVEVGLWWKLQALYFARGEYACMADAADGWVDANEELRSLLDGWEP